MTPRQLVIQGFRHHWTAHLAAALGVIAGAAALTGALLVGDAMRGSLRAVGLGRLGDVDYALASARFFREELADGFVEPNVRVSPAIFLSGSCVHADTRALSNRVNVFGIDERFRAVSRPPLSAVEIPDEGLVVILNTALAAELRAAVGDDVLLRVGKPDAIPADSVLGRRDAAAITLRLRVGAIVPAEGTAAFDLHPRQQAPRNAFVPLRTLQRTLNQRGRVNTLLVAAPHTEITALYDRLKPLLTLDDFGLGVRTPEVGIYAAVESDAFMIAPALEELLREAAFRSQVAVEAVSAYLANEIAVEARPERIVPYSTVAALERPERLRPSLVLPTDSTDFELVPGKIILNEWTAVELDAKLGERIRLIYYVADASGRLHTEQAAFELTGIVAMRPPAADPDFVPPYPGVTDTARLTDWDPPFPVDLRTIRERDEVYWEQWRTTPKAFVTSADAERLWAAADGPYGRITSLRLYPSAAGERTEAVRSFTRAFFDRLDPAAVGLRFDPIRERVREAGAGATDFGGLFIGFSSFLIASSAMLTALLFRLGVERRAREVGLLTALGYSPGRIMRLFLGEGVLTAALGAAAGLLLARGYAWLMILGLQTWWSKAADVPFLQTHDTASSYALGYVLSVSIALAAMLWSLRGLMQLSPRALLSGASSSRTEVSGAKRGRLAGRAALPAAAIAVICALLSPHFGAVSQSMAFFLGGAAMLIACLAAAADLLRREPRAVVAHGGFTALLRLGARNARRRSGRSLLAFGLVAAATFIIAALQAMRLDADREGDAKQSGAGGYALRAEASIPLLHDLNAAADRAKLGLSDEAEQLLTAARVIPFRLRGGDDASCLNLYRPRQPRILGATQAKIERGGFRFAQSAARSAAERENPWLLLRTRFDDGAIPAIADEDTVRWQLQSRLGGDISITDENGREVSLRIVATVRGSILQGELVIAEEHFRTLFPAISGYGYFLIEAPPEIVPSLEKALERELTAYGFFAEEAKRRLAELYAVQNTYLSTFQTLGGLGLLLGTLGLTAIMMRNVCERRSELALMQALGFSRSALGILVLSENALLVGAGMIAGIASAGLAIFPQLAANPDRLPWQSLLWTFALIYAVGMSAGAAALRVALRAAPLSALRSE